MALARFFLRRFAPGAAAAVAAKQTPNEESGDGEDKEELYEENDFERGRRLIDVDAETGTS